MPRINNRPLAPLDLSDRVRFFTKITIKTETECWPWTAETNYSGHGVLGLRVLREDGSRGFGTDGWSPFLASRIAYLIFYDTDPGELDVCHICDYPPCCNPYHLFLGTVLQNNLDRAQKFRTGGIKLSPEMISEIFGLSRQGLTSTQIVDRLKLPVKAKTVRDVIEGKTWRWLKMPIKITE